MPVCEREMRTKAGVAFDIFVCVDPNWLTPIPGRGPGPDKEGVRHQFSNVEQCLASSGLGASSSRRTGLYSSRGSARHEATQPRVFAFGDDPWRGKTEKYPLAVVGASWQ